MNHRLNRFGPILLATIFVIVVCVSIVGIEAWRSVTARDIAIRDREVVASNLAASLAQHAGDTFAQAKTATLDIVDRLESDGVGPRQIAAVHRALVKDMADIPQFRRLTVIDAGGACLTYDVAGPPCQKRYGEHDFFRYHLAHDDHDVHFGAPIRGRVTNQWTVTISRRFNDAAGRFGGVVLASIDLDFFTHYYGRFDIGRHGTIVLMDEDGIVINRRPDPERFVGKSLASSAMYRDHASKSREGTTRITSTIDGVDRIVAFKHLDEFPAYVVVGFSTEDSLADWAADTTVHAIGATILIVILLLLGARVITQISSRHRVELELTRSQVQLQALNVTLEDIARRDSLTGLFNRREFDRMIEEHLARVDADRQPVALIIVDVDDFKVYNDTYGHFLGDECLRVISATLKECVTRPADLVARYGGEEFVILLPATDCADALAVAENFRQAVNALNIPSEGSPVGRVSVSMGVSAVRPGDAHRSAQQLFDEADQALYAAKRNGKDRVERYELRLVA